MRMWFSSGATIAMIMATLMHGKTCQVHLVTVLHADNVDHCWLWFLSCRLGKWAQHFMATCATCLRGHNPCAAELQSQAAHGVSQCPCWKSWLGLTMFPLVQTVGQLPRTAEECRWVLLLLLTSAVIFSGLLGMLSDLVASVNKDWISEELATGFCSTAPGAPDSCS